MANKKDNRLSQKSKKALKAAYIELLSEKPINKISITDICAHADLSRPTFYAHFESKDEILMEYVSEIFHPIYLEIDALRMDSSPEEFLSTNQRFFQIWQKNAEIYQLLKKARMENRIQSTYKRMIQEAYFKNSKQASPINDDEIIDYLFSYFSAAIFSILDEWMAQGMQRTPEEMGAFVAIILAPDVIEKISEMYST